MSNKYDPHVQRVHQTSEPILEAMKKNGVSRVVVDITEVYMTELHYKRHLFTPFFVTQLYQHAIDCFDAGLQNMVSEISVRGNNIPDIETLSEEGKQAVIELWSRLVFKFYEICREHRLFASSEQTGQYIPLWVEHISITYVVFKINSTEVSPNLGRSYEL